MAMSTRKKVEIPDKAWLDTLKFLMGTHWQKVRFVSRQLAEVVRGNISELPRIVIDNVKFWEATMPLKLAEIVASNVTIPPNEKSEWFMKRGINLDAPTDLQHQNAFVSMGTKYENKNKHSIYYRADVIELSGESKTIRSEQDMTGRKLEWVSGQEFEMHRKPVLFSAEFNPGLDEYSWASIEYFLNLIYNPLTYIKEIEMYALNKNLTDALFLGEDYGNYIRCGNITLEGDLCKSLPWIHRNVRADTIYFPEDSTKNNSYKEACNFLLNTPWMCADETRNVNIKIEYVRYWKSLIKSLIKKFRTLDTIEHYTPSIEFSFWKYAGNTLYEYGDTLCETDETLNLNYLAWDPDVVKLKAEDSQSAEAAYMISHGRNRMEFGLFRKDDVETYWTKDFSNMYRGSKEAIYDVSIKMYTIQSETRSREKVYILDDTWLEALKFLRFSNWSKAFFVSRQFAGLVQANISRMPRIEIDSATMSTMTSMRSVVSFDDEIPSNEKKEFFTDFGISLNAPSNVQHENAVIGLSSKNSHSRDHSCEMCLYGTAQDMYQFQKPVIFSALFSKHQEHSWAALKYFLEFLYYPAVYTKEVEMYALNQQMVDDFFEAEERFIRCETFILKRETESWNMDGFRKALSWIERNVRANTIHFPENIGYKNDHFYEPIASFLLDASWKCASQEVHFKSPCNPDSFVKALVQKFQTVSSVQKDVPMFIASIYGNDETMSFLLLDPNVLKLESQDSEGADVYVISNGTNRMQIEVGKDHKHDIHGRLGPTRLGPNFGNWQNRNLRKLELYIKVNTI